MSRGSDAVARDARTSDLIERCQAGDRRALDQLYRTHRNEVFRTLRGLLRASADIDDVVQEVFIQVFRSIGKFKGQSRFSTWLYRVTVNVGLMYLRKRRSRPASFTTDKVPESRAPDRDDPQSEAMRGQKRAAVERILTTLSEKKRTVFVLHDLLGMKAQEISEVLDISVLTVRTRLHYARKGFYAAAQDESCLDGELN